MPETNITAQVPVAPSHDRQERRAQQSLDELQRRTKTVVAKATGALEALIPQIVGLEAEQAGAIRKAVADLRALVHDAKV